MGEDIRAAGRSGVLYDSLRYLGGGNLAAHRSTNVTDVIQTDHYEISVSAGAKRIEVRRLAA